MRRHDFGNPAARAVLVQPVEGRDLPMLEAGARLILGSGVRDFLLIALGVGDWNHDLSPWEVPPVLGREGFGGGSRQGALMQGPHHAFAGAR